MTDLIPVHVTVRPSDGVVSVRMLVETRAGIALYDGDVYNRIGQIREGQWTGKDRHGFTTRKKGWVWFYDEEEWGSESGVATTKAKALTALLEAGGYAVAEANAENPGLF